MEAHEMDGDSLRTKYEKINQSDTARTLLQEKWWHKRISPLRKFRIS